MIVSALAAAALYGAGAAIEQRQAAAAPQSAAGRPRLLLLLARQPLWLAGIAAQIAGFAAHAVALRSGPLATVQMAAGFSSADVTPALLGHLPAVVRDGLVAGYAESIQTVFLVAVPIAALAFLATWLIPQVELKQWSAPAAQNSGAGAPVTAETLDPQEAGWDGLDD